MRNMNRKPIRSESKAGGYFRFDGSQAQGRERLKICSFLFRQPKWEIILKKCQGFIFNGNFY